MTNTGVIKLNFSELPKEVQQKYGYDPGKAAAFAVAEADKRARQQQAILSAAATVVATPQPTAPPSSPPAPPVNTPARPPTDAPAPATAGLVLDKHWETTVLGGGSEARRDLGRLLSDFATPNPNVGGSSNLQIYQGVTYLMPLRDAASRLGVAGRLTSKNAVVCPGFPRDSMFYSAVDGAFEGDYNRMLIVTDRADQVLSIALESEQPRT